MSKTVAFNFGKNMEHVKRIIYNGLEIINTGYAYSAEDEIEKIPLDEIYQT